MKFQKSIVIAFILTLGSWCAMTSAQDYEWITEGYDLVTAHDGEGSLNSAAEPAYCNAATAVCVGTFHQIFKSILTDPSAGVHVQLQDHLRTWFEDNANCTMSGHGGLILRPYNSANPTASERDKHLYQQLVVSHALGQGMRVQVGRNAQNACTLLTLAIFSE